MTALLNSLLFCNVLNISFANVAICCVKLEKRRTIIVLQKTNEFYSKANLGVKKKNVPLMQTLMRPLKYH